jgi:hypothetical protein
MSWQALEQANPELADFGKARFAQGVAYLATVRKDGGPRVHPVTPIVGHGRLFLFMEPTSPKGYDLKRDGRYALHSAVHDSGGSNGEFIITGRGRLVEDAAIRALAVDAATYDPAERYILFELTIENALSTVYEEGQSVRQRWQQETT